MIDPKFAALFGLWFNADFIDLDDPAAVLDAIKACSEDVLRQIANFPAFAVALNAAIHAWDPGLIQSLCQTSQVDWYADVESQAALRSILNALARNLSADQ